MPRTIDRHITLRDIERARCQKSLEYFTRKAWDIIEPGEYLSNWHIGAICAHLEAVSNGQIKRLLINIPPRFMKSTLVSVMWNAWEWTFMPQTRWLCSSYSLSLSIRDSQRTRSVVESSWYKSLWGDTVELSAEQNAKSFFSNTRNGARLSISVGSAATGHGGDRIICDDPHNALEAESDTMREMTIDWWSKTMSSRLNNPKTGAFVVIMQRLHERDLAGYLLEQGGYTHLLIANEFDRRKIVTNIKWKEEDGTEHNTWTDPRTKERDLLWPDRVDKDTTLQLKRTLGSYAYSSQYQQSPAPVGGGKFNSKWFRYFSESHEAYMLDTPERGIVSILRSRCRTFGTVDLAISEKSSADYTVFAIWAVTPDNDLLLRHIFRDRITNAEQLRELQRLHSRFQVDYWKIETTAYQAAFYQQALRVGVPSRSFKPDKDKERRATTAAIWAENGKVYFQKHASWLTEFETELMIFPRGMHDDQVDCFSMASDDVCLPSAPLSGYMPDLARPAPPPLKEIMQSDPFEWANRHGLWKDTA